VGFKSIKENLKWALKRHPLLYYIRFALISKNLQKKDSAIPTFNDLNPKQEAPELFYKVSKDLPMTPEMDEFDKVLVIIKYLNNFQIKGSPGLGLSSDKMMQLLLDGTDGGVCSDHSQLFNVFCVVNDIQVREWGVVDKFYDAQFGHTFNEIYSTRLKKWILIDAWLSITFHAAESTEPLSVVETFDHLRKGIPIEHRTIHKTVSELTRIPLIYSKEARPFVISYYSNKVYDTYLNRYQDKYPGFLINAMLILVGKNYKFLFVMDDYKSLLFPFLKKKAVKFRDISIFAG
jgi:hypothetical protein